MKRIYLALLLSLLITPMAGSVTNAHDGYYTSEEEHQLEEARQDAQAEQSFREDLELESKVSAFEEQEEKERAEAAEANLQLLMYIALGVGGIILIYAISHLRQKHAVTPRSRK